MRSFVLLPCAVLATALPAVAQQRPWLAVGRGASTTNRYAVGTDLEGRVGLGPFSLGAGFGKAHDIVGCADFGVDAMGSGGGCSTSSGKRAEGWYLEPRIALTHAAKRKAWFVFVRSASFRDTRGRRATDRLNAAGIGGEGLWGTRSGVQFGMDWSAGLATWSGSKAEPGFILRGGLTLSSGRCPCGK